MKSKNSEKTKRGIFWGTKTVAEILIQYFRMTGNAGDYSRRVAKTLRKKYRYQ